METKQTKAHELLIRVDQKLDDLSVKLQEHISRDEPIIRDVPELKETVKWVTKMVVWAYVTVGTATVGAIAAYFTK